MLFGRQIFKGRRPTFNLADARLDRIQMSQIVDPQRLQIKLLDQVLIPFHMLHGRFQHRLPLRLPYGQSRS